MSQYLTDYATSNDLLNYDDFQDALHDVITTADTPLTVGVFGPWGSGKTSLMRMLREQIEDEKLDSQRTVWFTAWKYDRQDVLWRAFILRVLNALYPRESKPANRPREERPILQNPGEKQKAQIAMLQRLEKSVYQPVEWEEVGKRTIEWWKLMSNSTVAGADIAASFVPGAEAFKTLLTLVGGEKKSDKAIKEAAEAISRDVQAYHRDQLFHMEQFEKTFADTIAEILGDDGRLIVFVDDLDRCLPEKAVEVLEAIKLFLEVPGVVFLLGMDQSVIRRGIEARYGSYFQQLDGDDARSELPIRGDSYLQKIVQIPFHLPALAVEDITDFVQDLYKDLPKKDQLSERTLNVLARGVYPNPRQIKRLLNILRLLRRIADRRFQDEKEIEITDPLLAKTVIIQTQYPALYQLWRQYPTLVQTLESEYARRPSSDEERLTGLRQLKATPKTDEPDETEKESEAETSPEQPGGLLSKYLNDRVQYALLEQLMTYPPVNEAGEGADRDRFSGLSRGQVAAYVRLAGAVESDGPTPVDIPAPTLDALLSGDPVQIQDAASVLQGEDPERLQAVQQQMIQVLADGSQATPARLSAGNALAHLGDPRFYGAEGFHLPHDDMLGFVEIPAGNFRMGSDPTKDDQAREEEQPQHSLPLETFYMAKYPVTVAQFQLFVNESGHKVANDDSLQGLPNHPVRYVSWYDALAYCEWLQQRLAQWAQTPSVLSNRFQQQWCIVLPSEAEWEKAARGSDARIYPWGNTFDANNANHETTGLDGPSTVGCYPNGASPYGLHDMSGNVWDWTRTIWGEYDFNKNEFIREYNYPYEMNDGRERMDKQDNLVRVVRGGAYYNEPNVLRCAARGRRDPDSVLRGDGLRLCVSSFSP